MVVGIPHTPTTEAEEEANLKSHSLFDSAKPLKDSCLQGLEDFPSSFSDFDSISGWFAEGNIELFNMADIGGHPVVSGTVNSELGASLEVSGDRVLGKAESPLNLGTEKEKTEVVKRNSEIGSNGLCEKVNMEGFVDGNGSEELGSLIEEQLGKVSLEGPLNSSVPVVHLEDVYNDDGIGSMSGETVMLDSSSVRIGSAKETGEKIDGTVSGEDESDSDSESSEDDSESSSDEESESESSSDEDEDDDGGKKKSKNQEGIDDEETDIEEGECVLSEADEMVSFSDVDDEDDTIKGPITSRNEIKVLPPVPSVTVTLESHHQTLPVGVVSAILDAQVIVDGSEKHSPLDEGSILWITESRLPLGIVDEIFGPVKNPFYIVRYNSESEVPTGIQGASVSFVQEFAKHVLNDKNLYQKGYDASGENDEELADELEFSDDEKEAEYKRSLKKKRGKNKSNPGAERNGKGKVDSKSGKWNHNRSQPSVTTDQAQPHMAAQSPSFPSPSPSVWVPPQQQQQQQQQQNPGLGFPPNNNMLWMQQYQPYPLYQGHPQTVPGGLPLNFNPLSVPSNFGVGPPFGPWPTNLNQGMLSPSQFGMGMQAQQAPPMPMHMHMPMPMAMPQGFQMNHNLQAQQALPQPQMSNNMQQPSPASLGESDNFNQGQTGNFSQGRGRGGGGGGGRRGGHQRGRGHHGGRRVGHQNR